MQLFRKFSAFKPTTILSLMRSSLNVLNSQYSARQYKSVMKLSTDSLSCCPLGLNLALSNITFLLTTNELQTCLSLRHTASVPRQLFQMRQQCHRLLLPSSKLKCLLGSHRPFSRGQSPFEFVRNVLSSEATRRV